MAKPDRIGHQIKSRQDSRITKHRQPKSQAASGTTAGQVTCILAKITLNHHCQTSKRILKRILKRIGIGFSQSFLKSKAPRASIRPEHGIHHIHSSRNRRPLWLLGRNDCFKPV
jgi:hypothetical protein